MPFDRVAAEIELGPDLGVGATIGGEAGDVQLLRGELSALFHASPAYHLAGSREFLPGAFGECIHTHRRKRVVRLTKNGARINTTLPTPQPFAIEQLSACQFDSNLSAAQTGDRLSVEILGLVTVAELCLGSCRQA
jgi:hypothetical protein